MLPAGHDQLTFTTLLSVVSIYHKVRMFKEKSIPQLKQFEECRSNKFGHKKSGFHPHTGESKFKLKPDGGWTRPLGPHSA